MHLQLLKSHVSHGGCLLGVQMAFGSYSEKGIFKSAVGTADGKTVALKWDLGKTGPRVGVTEEQFRDGT